MTLIHLHSIRVNLKHMRKFLDKNAEALEPVFPDVFDDIRRADGRSIDDLMICWQTSFIEKDLTDQTLL